MTTLPKESDRVLGRDTAVSLPSLSLHPLALLLLAMFLLALALGSVDIPLLDIVAVVFGGEASKASWTTIVLDFRIPKALTAMLAGAALAVSGLQMQTLFRNPLAGPFVLGISSGASLGVALVVLTAGTTGGTLLAGLGLVGDSALAIAAVVGAGLVLALVMMMARRVDTMTLLILGLMFGYATSAIVSILLHFSLAERIQSYVAWTFGSFGGVTWRQMPVLAMAVVLGLLLAYLLAKSLDALLLGEAYAQSLGLNVRRVRLGLIVSTAVLAGAITAFCGPIGFLGLAVPHLARGLFRTANHRVLIPASALLGATLALFADILAQLPGSQTVLPLNAVTALIGAPVVVWVILRQKHKSAAFSK